MKRVFFIMASIAFLGLLLGTAMPANAYTWYSYGGHEYSLTERYDNWSGAEEEAMMMGGHLVTINDAEELNFLMATFQDVLPEGGGSPLSVSFFWIGLYNYGQITNLNDWQWISGDTSTYWQTALLGWGFPNVDIGIHAYLHATGHIGAGTINNDNRWDSYPPYPLGLIERTAAVPLPASLLLFGPGLAGLAFLRRRFER